MELNSKKARWNTFQDLRNKEKTQTRIQFLLNSFDNQISKPMESVNLRNYRFPALEKFISLQQTNSTPPQTAPRKCFKFRFITAKETNVFIDSLQTRKPLGPSRIPAMAKKLLKQRQQKHYVISLIGSLHKLNFKKILKKTCVYPLLRKEIPKSVSILDLFL